MKDKMIASEIKSEIKYHAEQISMVFSRRHVRGTDFRHNRYVIKQHIISMRELRHKEKYV